MSFDVDIAATFTTEGTDSFDLETEFSVETGETLVVLGPSGSGKTLLLETVAGYHDHDGHVGFDGHDVTDDPPEERGFGFVFQDYALFPHMTARENVAFGARYHPEARDADTVLADLGVDHLADRRPETLSGGERQRVALARSLAIRPAALLLDEPLSALDVPTREALRDDLRDLVADITAIHVTHNRTTARALADRIAVMRDGRIVQLGSVEDVFHRPATPFVAWFTGSNCLPVSALPDGTISGSSATHVAIRPEYVELDGSNPTAMASVTRITPRDGDDRVTLTLGDEEVTAFSNAALTVGESVPVTLPTDRLWSIEGGKAVEPSSAAVRRPTISGFG
ncbi:Fe3+/spermidine/putrescine ABC transporter ATP-binding protein [Haladaptatus sp. R4]|uniref:ABC transporter ATP-binding protein n=1 Tax=Haladaptatus sp. R4 TaxID=1679489 RepID=UPI0007B4B500|nr:ABC transporter ATP-binding protein [Haladaptatus sp. R4]KZN22937.1 Fe3+/spermidine/putrescine ABC transporter ATP-binding protein [Haladaptatus sp. R4]